MTEFSVLDWFWWLLVSLVILWWWPKHVRADFSARTNIQIAKFKVSFDDPIATPSPEPSPDTSPLPSPEVTPSPLPSPSPSPSPISELPTLRLISSNWGLVESAQATQLWQDLANTPDSPQLEPLAGCHVLENLQEPVDTSTNCVTNTAEPLAVPAAQKIFVRVDDEFQVLNPEMISPSEPGQLLITEVMWPGSYNGSVSWSYDEWLELYNPTAQVLDLSGIEIKNAGISGNSLFVPPGNYLPPLSYFIIGARQDDQTLLANNPDWATNQLSLSNSMANLSLVSSEGVELDTLPTGAWQAGKNSLIDRQRSSAQRISTVSPGNIWENWTDCQFKTLLPIQPYNWKPASAQSNCGSPWQATIYSVE